MRGIHLERINPDGSRFSAYLTPGGRDIATSAVSYSPDHTGEIPAPPPFEATGLRCYDAYAIHGDMPAVLWMLVDRLRRRRMRQAYRRRARRR